MTKKNLIALIAVQALLLSIASCFKIPFEVTLKNSIDFTEEQVKELADGIYEKLAELDFSEPAGSPEKECSDAYKIWLRKQFDLGLVPQWLILPSEYAATSTHPDKLKCRSIDFQEEYKNALDKSSSEETRKRKAMVFGLNDFRQALEKNKCAENFLDLDKEKVQIKAIHLNVLENTLSVKAPTYKLYTSYHDISEEELSETDAEINLKKNDIITLLGETRIVNKGFTGRLPVDLNSNDEEFGDAEGPIVSLGGTMIAIPGLIASTPETRTVGDKTYYIVPSGALRITISTDLDAILSLEDAICAFKQLAKSANEDDKVKPSRKRT